MKSVWSGAVTSMLFAAGALAPAIASAQAGGGSGITWPHQAGFWGHAGVSVGRTELDLECPAGASCDDRDESLRLFAGGRFNRTFGAEVGYVRFGDFPRAGGELESQALDFALMAGVPFGTNGNVFAKAGLAYSETDVTAQPGFGVQTGDADGWGPRFGVGVQWGFTQNWALRADWDRYRIDVPGGDENIDTLSVGVQYTFR